MKISELPIPSNIVDFFESQGYSDLFPPQSESVKAGLLDGNSILVSAPTASGKTFIATLAILNKLSQENSKIIYLSPLRALASEKYSEFKKLESLSFGRKIKVGISTGDFDLIEKNLEKNDIIVLTNEKMDSIMRQGVEWLDSIGLVIIDEIHLIGDNERGPTLEMILTRLKFLKNKPQILGLSATITNSQDIAEWLECILVQNNWRPVPLIEGVYDGGQVFMQDGTTFEVDATPRGPSIDLGIQSIKEGGQSLIFAETRSRSVQLAIKASDATSKFLQKENKPKLEDISQRLLDDNENTELVKTLSLLVKKGVAFHHAGLNQKCREVIETEFRNGNIKLLSSTPTLAAGVNLPARRVVISSIKRYNPQFGTNKPISILEYKQLVGRAGRPQFDNYGESILIANGNSSELMDFYVNGEPEPIQSKIIDDKSLRIHILSLVVTFPGIKSDGILDFFSKTLGGRQSRKSSIKFSIDMAIRFLENEDLLFRKNDRFAASTFGKLVSKLYIDPITAIYLKRLITKISTERTHTLGILHMISSCDEFFPKFSLRNKDYETLSLIIENNSHELIEPISEYDCNRSLLALYSWINEYTEISLSDDLGIESGDIHRMVEACNWLVHCTREIAIHLEKYELLSELDKLVPRIRYGIKTELLDLVKIKGIGRIRARKLYGNGIKNLEDLDKISVKKLAEIDKIGSILADNIKTQLPKVR